MLKTLITNTKITTIQLRIKEFLSNRHLEEEISKSILLAKETGTQLFINDYWEIALKKQAYGIHLGQEDAKSADLKKIEESGVRIGISTHCYHELVYAKHLNPSYIALGPIFETSAKKMDFYPQGLESLKTWIKLSECPVVAIGGVNKKNIKNVSDEKPDGISIISAIIDSKEGPIKSTNKLIQICSQTEGKSVR